MRGAILWRGPSLLDDAPIVAVATFGSSNRKTGPMVQTWILRARVHPVLAIRTGRDASVCGDCALRGDGTGQGRGCYVNVGQAPSAVYRAYRRGVYGPFDVEARSAVKGRAVRLGSYGDPAAVPDGVWRDLLAASGSGRWTGYSHQWRRAPQLRDICMASCDNVAEAADAAAAGWRAAMLGRQSSIPLAGVVVGSPTIACPATPQGGGRATCDRCALCAGASERTAKAPHVLFVPHGTGRAAAQALASGR